MTTRTHTTVQCDVGDDRQALSYTIIDRSSGTTYDVDLCDEHRYPLVEIIGYGRKVRSTAVRTPPKRRTVASRKAAGEIRARALADGVLLEPRGRIPEEIKRRYGAA